MKAKFNKLYDPRNNNLMCINGQLMLLDLIDKLEGHCELIQSNTDGLIISIPDTDEAFEAVDDICYEWEQRTGMGLGLDVISEIWQKDVNNYIWVDAEGGIERIGAYVKPLNDLDYDLPIVNKAVVDYLLNGIAPEKTVKTCTTLREFQRVVKVSSKYMHGLYSPTITEKKIRDDQGRLKTIKVFTGGEIQADTTFRVFASTNPAHGGMFKVSGKQDRWGRPKNPERFADTPDHCFFINTSVEGLPVPDELDREWYVAMAWKRLNDFGVERR